MNSTEKLTAVVDLLNERKWRATYKAVGDLIGVHQQNVGEMLGDRRPWASWVVAEATGQPTGYSENEKHPDLESKSNVIKSADVLARFITF